MPRYDNSLLVIETLPLIIKKPGIYMLQGFPCVKLISNTAVYKSYTIFIYYSNLHF